MIPPNAQVAFAGVELTGRGKLRRPPVGLCFRLHRLLLRLSIRLWWHPYWKSVPSVPAARAELRQLASARGAARAA
ncbi:hypothetical protein ACFY3M_45255 [Streptomyces mirabilis]|uniref:hypothetical protein n=1 Tax=Streptomyces mirabilis TaxID=68239 RepID=UPI0036C78CEB